MPSISSYGGLDSQQIGALIRMQKIGKAISKNTERIQTMRRINSAADDPAGLISASQLESELASLEATSKGLGRANAMLNTADAAAGEIVDQLQQARTVALAVAGGSLSGEEIAGKQAELDQIIRAIDSLAKTEFNGRRLLDGSSSFRAVGVDATRIRDVEIVDKQTASDVAVTVNVTTQATQASNSYSGGTLGAAATVVVNGPQGSAAVALSSGATTTDITDAFNAVNYLTGVTATRVDASNVSFKTNDYGSSASMSFTTTTGTFNFSSGGTVTGTDAVATINGQVVTGDGSTFSVTTNQASLSISVAPTVSGEIASFTVSGEGLQFVLGESPASTTRIGLPELNSATLGGVNGALYTVTSGGTKSLTGGNAADAIRIIDDALSQALTAQAAVGSFQKYTIGSSKNMADKAIENVSEAFNEVAGTDVALETAQLTNNQLLQQAAIESLQLFNQHRRNILSLLSGLSSRT